MKQNFIDKLSLSVLRISSFFENKLIGTSSGFLYKRNDRSFVITNWHVATGRNPANPNVSEDGSFTSEVRLTFMQSGGGDIVKTNHLINHSIKLNDSDAKSICWFQHPLVGRKVDLAVIPIDIPSNAAHEHLNDHKFFNRFILEVGDPVFVLGFPWGLAGTGTTLPIWKGGYVSSIPGVNYSGRPCFLIDSRTFKGMSGSPVICRYTLSLSTRKIFQHQKETDPVAGTLDYFCGVYSGRAIIDDEKRTETDLGYVWRPELIDEIIDGNAVGCILES